MRAKDWFSSSPLEAISLPKIFLVVWLDLGLVGLIGFGFGRHSLLLFIQLFQMFGLAFGQVTQFGLFVRRMTQVGQMTQFDFFDFDSPTRTILFLPFAFPLRRMILISAQSRYFPYRNSQVRQSGREFEVSLRYSISK